MNFILALICLLATALIAYNQIRTDRKIAEIIVANNALDDDLGRAEQIIHRLDRELEAFQVVSFDDPAVGDKKAA